MSVTLVDPKDVHNAITDKTTLVSIMTANNEVGTLASISEIGGIARDHGILFHTDAAQAVGHIPTNVDTMKIDLISFSSHKIYGPKGIGALYMREFGLRARITPMINGGTGTKNTIRDTKRVWNHRICKGD